MGGMKTHLGRGGHQYNKSDGPTGKDKRDAPKKTGQFIYRGKIKYITQQQPERITIIKLEKKTIKCL